MKNFLNEKKIHSSLFRFIIMKGECDAASLYFKFFQGRWKLSKSWFVKIS